MIAFLFTIARMAKIKNIPILYILPFLKHRAHQLKGNIYGENISLNHTKKVLDLLTHKTPGKQKCSFLLRTSEHSTQYLRTPEVPQY